MNKSNREGDKKVDNINCDFFSHQLKQSLLTRQLKRFVIAAHFFPVTSINLTLVPVFVIGCIVQKKI